MRSLVSLLAGASVASTSYIAGGGPDTYVPGKAFDRFITIWLENQVRRSAGSFGEGVNYWADTRAGLRSSQPEP